VRAILTFHQLAAGASPLCFPPQKFARLVEQLQRAGYHFLDLDSLLKPKAPERAVAFTFDDGYASVIHQAAPVLRDAGAPAHLFLATGLVGAEEFDHRPGKMLSWAEVDRLAAESWFIECHTASHCDLRDCSNARIASECEAADVAIETRVGRRPRYFAYPFGKHDPRIRAQMMGRYAGAVTTELRALEGHGDPNQIPRIDAYYLRSGVGRRSVLSAAGPAYLAARRMLRIVRGAN